MPQTNIQINTAFQGTGAGAAEVALGKVGTTATKAERDLLAYAAAVAKSQRTQGDAAAAVKTYEAALLQVDRTSKQAIATEAQLASSINTVRREAEKGPILPRTVEEFGTGAIDQLKSSLLGVLGPAALVTTALSAIPKAIDLAEMGAQAEVVRARFDSLSKAAGTTGDALLTALRAASGGQISDLNLQLTANRAQLLGVAHDANTFAQLMAIARDRAQNLGTTTQSAFDDIVTGIGRASPRILDNLGIIISEKEAYDNFAKSLGKSGDALTENEKKQAILTAVLEQGNATIQATGGAVEGAAAGQARLGASIENVKTKLGSFIADGVSPTVNGLSDLLNGLDGTVDSAATASTAYTQLYRQLLGLPPVTRDVQKAQEDWTKSIYEWIAAREVQLGLAAAPAAPSSGGGGAFQFPDEARAQQAIQAQRAYADALELTGVRSRAAQQAVEQKSNADKVAAIDSQTHAIAEQKLADQAQKAANALLTAGPAGARTAALLAGSSSQIDILTAAYYRLAAAKQAALPDQSQQTRAAAFTERHGGLEGGALTPAQRGITATTTLTNNQNAAAQKAAQAEEARRQQMIQTGTAAQKIATLQKEYNDAVARSGKNSKEAIDAQTNLIQAQQAAAKADAKTGRTRIDAAQSTALQLQNIEQDSGLQLARIQRENLERLRDQQEDFDVKRARSQEDEDRKIRRLLASGQRGAAAREKEDFAIEQRRAQEDFDRERRRTIRNNQESTGDTTAKADLNQQQVENRAALRGVKAGTVAGGTAGAPVAIANAPQVAGAPQARIIQIVVNGRVDMDGHQVGQLIYNAGLRETIDTDLAVELSTIGITLPPGGGQTAVAGATP